MAKSHLARDRLGSTRSSSGVKDFSSHRLRHTYAYRWVRNGGSLATLQQVLGHADLSDRSAHLGNVVNTSIPREVARWPARGHLSPSSCRSTSDHSGAYTPR